MTRQPQTSAGFSWPQTFGLKENPFRDSLDPNLFFRTRQHEEALLKIRIGIDDGHALILLSGASGTGKSMVSQVALRDIGHGHETALVFVYPGMGKGQLLDAILSEMGEKETGRFTQQRLDLLQQKSVALYREGKRLVVMIDEAHFLKADALHLLRTLANLETARRKLITVLLIAEPGLRKRLATPGYAALRGRITFMVDLHPLTQEETEQYIKYRLLKCGGYGDLLPPAVYVAAHELSHGIPREINRLLYNSMIEALTSDHFGVTPQILQTVADRQEGRWAR
ncbi:MAG: AAA family ATPase [Desulfobulbaceae bacterium]|nr:AAA family ATPase [Desulfobulbaceae bacterium]